MLSFSFSAIFYLFEQTLVWGGLSNAMVLRQSFMLTDMRCPCIFIGAATTLSLLSSTYVYYKLLYPPPSTSTPCPFSQISLTSYSSISQQLDMGALASVAHNFKPSVRKKRKRETQENAQKFGKTGT